MLLWSKGKACVPSVGCVLPSFKLKGKRRFTIHCFLTDTPGGMTGGT